MADNVYASVNINGIVNIYDNDNAIENVPENVSETIYYVIIDKNNSATVYTREEFLLTFEKQ